MASSVTLRAIVRSGGPTTYSLGQDLVYETRSRLRFEYAINLLESDSIDGALGAMPSLSPPSVLDCGEPAPSWRLARARARQIVEQWPEARLGIVFVDSTPSPFVRLEHAFRGRDLRVLGVRRKPACTDESNG